MSLQQIRGAMAKLTSDALVAAGLPFAVQYWDNVQETPAQPDTAYAVISMSFPEMVAETIGCDGADKILGTCNLNLYMPKRQGMKPGEDIAVAVIQAWVGVNRNTVADTTGVRLHTRNITGPSPLAPDARPHQVINLSCAFTGRVP